MIRNSLGSAGIRSNSLHEMAPVRCTVGGRLTIEPRAFLFPVLYHLVDQKVCSTDIFGHLLDNYPEHPSVPTEKTARQEWLLCEERRVGVHRAGSLPGFKGQWGCRQPVVCTVSQGNQLRALLAPTAGLG